MPNLRQWINKLYYSPKISMQRTPLDFYVAKLEKNEPFSFSRFGDGEWSALLGKRGANCDGHEYFPEMSLQLQNAIIHSYSYIYGMQNFAIKNMGRLIYGFLKKHKITLHWRNSDVFHYANIAGEMNPLIRAMRKYTVVVIGPHYLRPVALKLFNSESFIEIPANNCFLAIDEIEKKIKAFGQGKKRIVYAFSASMAANCIIHDLYPDFGADNWLIDFGSLWDIYAGVKSRSVYAHDGWEEKIRKNTAE